MVVFVWVGRRSHNLVSFLVVRTSKDCFENFRIIIADNRALKLVTLWRARKADSLPLNCEVAQRAVTLGRGNAIVCPYIPPYAEKLAQGTC